MKTKHDGDCSIYSALLNSTPEDGICTCGYAHERQPEMFETGRTAEWYTLMYSEELLERMAENKELKR